MPSFLRSLFGQVVVALVLGVLVGMLWPDFAAQLKPLGDGFIKLIKMMIAPLVFGVVVHGIAGAGDLKKVGRVGVKAIVYFEVVTTVALVLGIVRGLCVRSRARDEHRRLDARRQRARRIHRPCRAGHRHRRFPASHHPGDPDRRLCRRRHPAGAADRGPLRRRPVALGRARPAGHALHRAPYRHPVQDDRLHHQAGAVRRLRRHRLHRRRVRRRLAAAARLPRRALLPGGRGVRLRRARADHAAGGLQHLQVPRLPARRAPDRARHRLVRQRAAAGHAQAGAARHQGLPPSASSSRPATRSTSTPSRSI